MTVPKSGLFQVERKTVSEHIRIYINDKKLYVTGVSGPQLKLVLSRQQIEALSCEELPFDIEIPQENETFGTLSAYIGYSAVDLGPHDRNILSCNIKIRQKYKSQLDIEISGKLGPLLLNTAAEYCRPKNVKDNDGDYAVRFCLSEDDISKNFTGDIAEALLSIFCILQ